MYVLITDLKAENPQVYKYIKPFLGPFHIQCVMMSAIFKRYMGSELEEVLVAGGVIAAGSVQKALKGIHYKRGIRCFRLMYEALTCQLAKRLIPKLSIEINSNLEILSDLSQSQEFHLAAHI